MQFPRTLVEFQDQFPDEAHCWAYLRRAGWPRGFECPRCGGRGSHFLASRRLDQCRTCRYQGSVTAGTVFHGTRVSLRVWFFGRFLPGPSQEGSFGASAPEGHRVGELSNGLDVASQASMGPSALPAPLLEGHIEAGIPS